MGWYLAGAGVLLLVALRRFVAVGRKNPVTLSEQRKAAFKDLPVAYRVTQPVNRWRLRLHRTHERRRSA